MLEKQKKLNIFKVLALKLHKNSVWFFRRSYHLKPKKTTRSYLLAFLASKGMPVNRVSVPDRVYEYLTITEMKDIILHDWTDRMKYKDNIADCDDFADIFQSHMKERYKINSVAEARHIELLDIETKGHLNWHRANIFIADDNNVMKLYFLEPQTDRVVEVKDYNELIRLTGWLNKLNIFDF